MTATTTTTNPYLKLPITFDPDTFYGPFETVRFLLETISETQTLAPIELFALPGMGKSTLLRYIAHPKGALARNIHWLHQPFEGQPQRLFPVLVEFRLMPPPPDSRSFVYLHERFCKEYTDYQSRVQGIPGIDSPEIDVSTPQKPEEAINLLKLNSKRLAERKIRPVLLLDDFDLPFEKMSVNEATWLRPLRDYVALVMAIERPLHVVNKEAAGSPLFQNTPLRRLEGLSAEEARELLEEPAQQARTPFPTGDIEFILQYTSGHPYLIILAGRALWDMRKRLGLLDRDTPLKSDQQTILLGHLANDFGPSFELYWKRLDAHERSILKNLVQRQTPLDKLQYKLLSNLLELGLVKYVPNGGYKIFSPLFADFVELTDEANEGSVQRDISDSNTSTNLTGFENRLLDYLRLHSSRVCTYEELWQEVWNQSPYTGDREQMRRRMQVTVSRLRPKLPAGEDIISVRDQGYKLVS